MFIWKGNLLIKISFLHKTNKTKSFSHFKHAGLSGKINKHLKRCRSQYLYILEHKSLKDTGENVKLFFRII